MTTPIDILTRSELKAIVGTPVREKQIEWLTRQGWPHEVNIHGYPVVLRSVALEKLGGEVPEQVWSLDERNVA